MTAPAFRTVACPCGTPAARPCAPGGDHLARYLRAEQAGVISRGQLTAAIAALTVLAPNVIVPAAATAPAQPPEKEATP